MDNPKYIVVEFPSGRQDVILIPMWKAHIDSVPPNGNVIGAGMFHLFFDNDGRAGAHGMINVRAFGESISCKVKSRGEEDARLIASFLQIRDFE